MSHDIPEGPVSVSEPLPPAVLQAIKEFNDGHYYPCHDTIEEHWVRETGVQRVLYQGILQIGIGLFHIENGNWRGATKMFERGLPKLRPFVPVCQGIDVKNLLEAAEKIDASLIRLGPERIADFDQTLFPKILVDGRAPHLGPGEAPNEREEA